MRGAFGFMLSLVLFIGAVHAGSGCGEAHAQSAAVGGQLCRDGKACAPDSLKVRRSAFFDAGVTVRQSVTAAEFLFPDAGSILAGAGGVSDAGYGWAADRRRAWQCNVPGTGTTVVCNSNVPSGAGAFIAVQQRGYGQQLYRTQASGGTGLLGMFTAPAAGPCTYHSLPVWTYRGGPINANTTSGAWRYMFGMTNGNNAPSLPIIDAGTIATALQYAFIGTSTDASPQAVNGGGRGWYCCTGNGTTGSCDFMGDITVGPTYQPNTTYTIDMRETGVVTCILDELDTGDHYVVRKTTHLPATSGGSELLTFPVAAGFVKTVTGEFGTYLSWFEQTCL